MRLGQRPISYRALIDEAESIAQQTGATLITQESTRYGLTD